MGKQVRKIIHKKNNSEEFGEKRGEPREKSDMRYERIDDVEIDKGNEHRQ